MPTAALARHNLSRALDCLKHTPPLLTWYIIQVLPLTQNVGVIEWVPGTLAFGHYLTATDTGAHLRYKLGKLTPKQCRTKMLGKSLGSQGETGDWG